jgi:site-specific DNA recombinase
MNSCPLSGSASTPTRPCPTPPRLFRLLLTDRIATTAHLHRLPQYRPGRKPATDAVHRSLTEAALVHWIFRCYTQVGGGIHLVEELNHKGKRTKSWTTARGKERAGVAWTKSHLYKLLSNPIFIGRVRHKDETYEGEHEAIIEKALWDEVQEKLAENSRVKGARSRSKTPAMLKGLIRCGHCGTPMGITFTNNHGRRYRYYLCTRAAQSGYKTCPVRTVPAGDIERAVLIHLRRVFQAVEIREPALRLIQEREESERVRLATERRELDEQVGVLRANASRLLQAGLEQGGPKGLVTDELGQMNAEAEGLEQRLAVVDAELDLLLREPTTEERLACELEAFDRLWDELFPAEQE